jgi:hypothetical protein
LARDLAEYKAYIDSCIPIGWSKSTTDPREIVAVNEILNMHESGIVRLLYSSVVTDEVKEEKQRELLKRLDALPIPTIGGLTSIGPALLIRGNVRHREWQRIRDILPRKEKGMRRAQENAERDAWHVFVASRNRCRYLITLDQNTMLNFKLEVEGATGVHLVRPSEFLDHIMKMMG